VKQIDLSDIDLQIEKIQHEIKELEIKIKDKKGEIEQLNQLKIKIKLMASIPPNLLSFFGSDELYEHNITSLDLIIELKYPPESRSLKHLLEDSIETLDKLFDKIFTTPELDLINRRLGIPSSGNKPQKIHQLIKYLTITNPSGNIKFLKQKPYVCTNCSTRRDEPIICCGRPMIMRIINHRFN
jgi:hypothetical protein